METVYPYTIIELCEGYEDFESVGGTILDREPNRYFTKGSVNGLLMERNGEIFIPCKVMGLGKMTFDDDEDMAKNISKLIQERKDELGIGE